MGRLVEYILLLVSVVLVVSTLTGSTNNYYNGKIHDCYTNGQYTCFNYIYYQQQEPTGGKDCCKFSNTLLIYFINFKLLLRNLENSLMHQ